MIGQVLIDGRVFALGATVTRCKRLIYALCKSCNYVRQTDTVSPGFGPSRHVHFFVHFAVFHHENRIGLRPIIFVGFRRFNHSLFNMKELIR